MDNSDTIAFDPMDPTSIMFVAEECLKRFEHTRSIDDLDRAVMMTKWATMKAKETKRRDYAEFLDMLGDVLVQRFRRTTSIDDLNEAVKARERAVRFMPKEYTDNIAVCYSKLGTVLRLRCERSGTTEDIDRAVSVIEQALNMRATDGVIWDNLGGALLRRFILRESITDLDRAIQSANQAVELTRDEPVLVQHARFLNNLAMMHRVRYDHLNQLMDIDLAISVVSRSLTLSRNFGAPIWNILSTWASVLHSRSDANDSMDDLNAAIRGREEAIELIPKDDTIEYANSLHNLSLSLARRFNRKDDTEDLERAIHLAEQAVLLLPEDHPRLPGYLQNLGGYLQDRSERRDSENDIDCAVSIKHLAVELTQREFLPSRLNAYANSLQERFWLKDTIEDLNESIRIYERAVELTLEHHTERSKHLNNLGTALRCRFERMENQEDLDKAVASGELAVKLVANNAEDHALHLNNLASSYRDQFVVTGALEVLSSAIDAHKRAMDVTPTDHPRYVIYLGNFAITQAKGAEKSGVLEDLDAAIENVREAVRLTPTDRPNHRNYLNNLSTDLMHRFELTGSMTDLEDAVDKSFELLAATSASHRHRAMYLHNTSTVIFRRYKRTKLREDIDLVIKLAEEANKLIVCSHPNRATALNTLGLALHNRFEVTGTKDDIDRAITLDLEAVSLAESNPLDCSTFLSNLGVALLTRFRLDNCECDINQAIEVHERAVNLMPPDNPAQAYVLINLSNALRIRFAYKNNESDLERAMISSEKAAAITAAPPSIRLSAIQGICQEIKDPHRAKPLLIKAVELLPTVCFRTLTNSDKQYNVSQFADITSRAVSVLLECGDTPHSALQLLELGRGVLSSLQLEVRSDITLLKTTHADLARQFDNLRAQLDRPPERLTKTQDPRQPYSASSMDHGRKISNEFRRILTSIRNLKGFERFLLGPTESELKEMARNGPLVVFNVSELRSDAFLVKSDNIHSMQLAQLNHTELQAKVANFQSAIEGKYGRNHAKSKSKLNKILEWLWNVAVGPVLDALGFTTTPGADPWPRVWWVGSGLLNMLPIHAAGYHDAATSLAALDRVISSYTPTVKALVYARERGENIYNLKPKALLISMPETPGLKPLRFVKDEVQNLLGLGFQSKVLQSPTKLEVMAALPDHTIVHFACHAYSAIDPSESRLVLDDWESAPLTASDLTSLNLQISQFAYLSACQTATTKDSRLLDESIHLCSAIQLAGFPSVVGSLWEVSDEHSAEVARIVYDRMLIKDKLDIQHAAEGLHHAVRTLRQKTRKGIDGFIRPVLNDPLLWAPYIHFGI